MAIPTFDKLLRPVLSIAVREPITRRSMTEVMTKEFQLSPAEAEQRLPSGQVTVIRNRVGWAMHYLTRAGLIEKVAAKTWRASSTAAAFLEAHPSSITAKDLKSIPGFDGWVGVRNRKKTIETGENPISASSDTATPQEVIDREVSALVAGLRERLLKAILDQTPEFFEQLVLDVLLAMGYGGSREAAAKRLGRSGDEGIDGRIDQDALGLDQIMVQAKRYRPDNVVDRKTIQAFIGSLAGQGVTKGVFITTSSFAESAKDFVLRGSTTKVVLVDGDMLIDRMIQHRIGVRVAHTFEIHELDQNYFDEGE
jgi:restriction system protein